MLAFVLDIPLSGEAIPCPSEDEEGDEGEEGDEEGIGMNTTFLMPKAVPLRPRCLQFGERKNNNSAQSLMLQAMANPFFVNILPSSSASASSNRPIWDENFVKGAIRAAEVYSSLLFQEGDSLMFHFQGKSFPCSIFRCLAEVYEWEKMPEGLPNYKLLERFTIQAVLFKHYDACMRGLDRVFLKDTFLFLRDVFFPFCESTI